MRDMLLAARLAVDKAGKAAALVPDQLAAFVELLGGSSARPRLPSRVAQAGG